uniref:DJ-1/PfpI domain-containing protein n=1 Tax=Meloidogyne enterolobii TaxID=390850 RepID=A0A6V7UPS6_MELEN|nr:unnamed protein product [Meloidogyne enterolobii]
MLYLRMWQKKNLMLSFCLEANLDRTILQNIAITDERVGKLLQRHEKEGKIVAAICAAPIALVSHGIAKKEGGGGTLTSYPSVKEKIINGGYNYSEDKVCVWKNIVTSRGPGTAFLFSLKLVEMLTDLEKSETVKKALLYNI